MIEALVVLLVGTVLGVVGSELIHRSFNKLTGGVRND